MWPGQAFVGVSRGVGEWEGVAAAAGRARTGHTVEEALLALLDTTPSPGLELIELGAVNAWFSVPPEPLWRRGETPQDIYSLPERRADLATCTHPLAVEFAV